MVFIYTTFPSKEEAEKVGRMLLEKRAAVCVNIWPINSAYRWQDKIELNDEIAMLIKTAEHKADEIENIIRENHSYKVPCIAAISVLRVNREYKEYLAGEIK